ncbi:F0F1 ATP synthase subunit delta [Candidatus Saccharibacteria bacterium]|nr:F0F1 ATP synthase subunit delta [Candidatus Saccharibacteria bacterium]
MAKLSRRKISAHAASRIAGGEPKITVLRDIAAYLIDSGRKSEARLIVRDIEATLLDEGMAIGTVTSARSLSASALDTITAFVKHSNSKIKHVVLREHIDESLIGGMKLELPGKQLDASVKAKLDKITA